MAACRSCEAPITWVVTASGKRMPLDEAPAATGNMVIVDGVARFVSAEDLRLIRPTYTSHFATCPDAATHRRPR
jgi:hypothetical protein